MRILGLAALVAATLHAPASADDHEAVAAKIDSIAGHFSQAPITGMTIAVSRDGKVIFVRGYGYADLDEQAPVQTDTVYEIGSITKEFTAAAILRLAEQGQLRLDAPISEYFPELAEKAAGVTVEHLLSHTSGLSRALPVEDLTAPMDPQDIVPFLASRDAEFAPGERYAYNNNGFNLLGLLIERASGTTWQEYLERELFRPLGLGSTRVCTTPRDPKVSKAYRHPTRGSAGPTEFERHHPTVNFAAGSICSTATDLLRWQEALVSGKVISSQSAALMSSPAILASGRPAPYGLGMFSDNNLGERHFHHGGASSGFITQVGYFPEDRTTIAVLTNGIYAGSIVELIEQSVLRASRGEDPGLPVDLPLSAEQRSAYVGVYDLGPVKVEVYEQDGILRAQPGDQVATRLLYQGEETFIAEHDPHIAFMFERVDGRAASLVLKNRGRAMPPARRVAD